MALLEVRGVEAGYGPLQILWGLDLDVAAGETVLLLGANSAGKTTLLRTLIGLLPCRGGSIRFDGERIDALAPDQRIRRGIAFMSELGVFPTLTIDENIALGGYFLSDAQMRARRDALFQVFPDLVAKRRQPAASLSGGQRKMLGIAKALAARPRLLVMDEPSAGLSPLFVQQVIAVLGRFRAEGDGLAMLIAEQNVAFLDLAERVYTLEGGRVRFSGTVAELHADDALHRAYFGLA